MHFYRNFFSHVPATKVREVAHMLKAIHAEASREAAAAKAEVVIAELRRQRMGKAADLLEERIQETLTFYAFPDGKSCLNLAAARLRHVAGTEWSTRRYMNMQPLHEMKLQPHGAAVA